ncbi:UNVERIFIED_CONTAM: hypothetical protein FKN15_041430 [Acipenser sinensis]
MTGLSAPPTLERLPLAGFRVMGRDYPGPLVAAQDATEDEEAAEDIIAEDEDDEAEVEDDETTDLTEEKEEEEEDATSGEAKASPNADTTILFVKGEGFPANNIVKFLVGFTNKGSEDFVVESLDASFRYPQDYQFYIQNFTALQLNTVVQSQRQATFEYSFIPAEPMGGRPFGLVINLNYKDTNLFMFTYIFKIAIFTHESSLNRSIHILYSCKWLCNILYWYPLPRVFLYVFLSGLGLLVIVGLHQLLESRKRRRPATKVEMGTSNHNDVDMSWIPQETLNQISKLCFCSVCSRMIYKEIKNKLNCNNSKTIIFFYAFVYFLIFPDCIRQSMLQKTSLLNSLS